MTKTTSQTSVRFSAVPDLVASLHFADPVSNDKIPEAQAPSYQSGGRSTSELPLWSSPKDI